MKKSTFRLSEADYESIRRYFLDNFALILPSDITDQKLFQIELLCRDERIESPLNLLTTNTKNDVTRGLSKLISIFTINHTDFFREQLHFDFFTSEILPNISSDTPSIIDNDIRIWSAASSTGEEPYSILMAMIDFFGDDYWKLDAGVLATDIDKEALSKGINGIFRHSKVKKLSRKKISKFFSRLNDREYLIEERLRKEILFRWLNLNATKFPMKNNFHVIFCRNVLQYFPIDIRGQIVQKLSNCLFKNGYLFLGISETYIMEQHDLSRVGPAIYQKMN
jgi:chemotaxis protein methyltransferase CheR